MTFELKAPPSKCNRHTRIILNYFWTSMEWKFHSLSYTIRSSLDNAPLKAHRLSVGRVPWGISSGSLWTFMKWVFLGGKNH
jgi:hypothetical protein